MEIVAEARELAEDRLAVDLPRRWSHVQAVGAKAARVAVALDPDDREVLVAAAWLHDIGYAPRVANGFHPLDGARWLRRIGFDERVTALVAYHTCALIEADERGLADALSAEFADEESATTDALLFCDITTGPDGQDFEPAERMQEIRIRYGPDDVVTRFIDRAEADIQAAVDRTRARLRRAGQPM